MNSYLGEMVGYLSGICTTLAFLPQAIKSIRTKNVSGLSVVYVYHILPGLGVLDSLWCIFEFISDNTI